MSKLNEIFLKSKSQNHNKKKEKEEALSTPSDLEKIKEIVKSNRNISGGKRLKKKKKSRKKKSFRKSGGGKRTMPEAAKKFIEFAQYIASELDVAYGRAVLKTASYYKKLAQEKDPKMDSISSIAKAKKLFENDSSRQKVYNKIKDESKSKTKRTSKRKSKKSSKKSSKLSKK